MRLRAFIPFATAVLVTGACAPGDRDDFDDFPPNDIAQEPTPEIRAQFMAFRAEVDSILTAVREDVELIRDDLQGEPLEEWAEASERVEQARGDVLIHLDQLDAATVDEARQIRDAAAERVAELEAELARQELRLTSEPGGALELAMEHLTELDERVETIAFLAAEHPDPGMTGYPTRDDTDPMHDPDMPTRDPDVAIPDQPGAQWSEPGLDQYQSRTNVNDLREELASAREEIATRLMSPDEDFEDAREDVADRVADLTRDVHREWYSSRYRFGDERTGQ